MSDGFEGQVWRDSFLAATRWWPATPSSRDWLIFLRASGLDLSQHPLPSPTPTEAPLLTNPWTIAATPITDVWSLLQNDRAAAIAATVVLAPFLYLLGQIATLSVATMTTEHRLSTLAATNQSIRADRTAALADFDAIESFLSLEAFPPQFEVIAAAVGILRDKQVVVTDWTYDSGSLNIVLQADRPLDAPSFIAMFEADDHFSNVSGSPTNQERELRLTLQVDERSWPSN
jgi:hypothetical protein